MKNRKIVGTPWQWGRIGDSIDSPWFDPPNMDFDCIDGGT